MTERLAFTALLVLGAFCVAMGTTGGLALILRGAVAYGAAGCGAC